MPSENYGMRLDDEIVREWREAHGAYKAGNIEAAARIYRELRRDHGVELFFEIKPPENVRFVHPIGCVLGRATYAEHLVCYQASGVGSDLDGNRPTFSGPCVLFPGARVLGRANIGSNVFITANTVVQNCEVPDNSVVFPAPFTGASNGHDGFKYVSKVSASWKPTKRSVKEAFFK